MEQGGDESKGVKGVGWGFGGFGQGIELRMFSWWIPWVC